MKRHRVKADIFAILWISSVRPAQMCVRGQDRTPGVCAKPTAVMAALEATQASVYM